jgi:predicted ArsR family transcriptional regulator
MSDQPIGILQQRRIEAAVIKPLVQAFEKELGRERTHEIVATVIKTLAQETGAELARAHSGKNPIRAFAESLEPWTRGGALELEVLAQDEERFHFNVTRCRYAEMYRELGLAELGYTLSCNRDAALIEGFSDEISFDRSQTIMQGAAHCDFRYQRKK